MRIICHLQMNENTLITLYWDLNKKSLQMHKKILKITL